MDEINRMMMKYLGKENFNTLVFFIVNISFKHSTEINSVNTKNKDEPI